MYWFINNQKVDENSSGVKIEVNNNNHKLILDSTIHSGTVLCRAENIIGIFETKAKLIVEKVKKAPVFTQSLTDKTEIEENIAIFEVTIDSEPLAQFQWTLNDQKLIRSNVFNIIFFNYNKFIKKNLI